jgi:hypothetical protein
VVVLVSVDSDLGLKLADIADRDLSALKVVVVLDGHIAGSPVVVWGTVARLEARELLSHGHLALHHAAKVPLGEQSVVGDNVVKSVGLVIMEMLEVSGIRMAEIEGQESVTIIDTIKFTTLQELPDVVLNNWSLVDGGSLSSGGIDTNAVTEGKDVLEALVLKSVWININNTLIIGDLRVEQLLVRLARRIDHSCEEVFLNDLISVNIAESCNLLSVLVGVNLDHLPPEEDINTSFLALFEGNLIGVGELVDLLVRSPVLNAGVLSSTSLKDVLAEEVFVVESIEVGSFALVREFRGIADKITVGVVPAVIVVVINTLLDVDSVNEHIALGITLVIGEAFNEVNLVIEACRKN